MDLNLNGLPTIPAQALTNALRSVRRTEVVEAKSTTAGARFIVKHGLGSRPSAFLYSTDTNGAYVWASRDDKAIWSATEVALHCSVANVAVSVVLLD